MIIAFINNDYSSRHSITRFRGQRQVDPREFKTGLGLNQLGEFQASQGNIVKPYIEIIISIAVISTSVMKNVKEKQKLAGNIKRFVLCSSY